MLGWLAAFCLFWVTASIYLGGMSVELDGGGSLRQLLGLLLLNLLFLGSWRALHLALGGVGGVPGVVLPLLITVLLLPVLARVGFGVVGVKLRREGSVAAH